MSKKKATKKKASSKPKPEPPMSKGFGHLTIREDWLVRDTSTVNGGEYSQPYDDWYDDTEGD